MTYANYGHANPSNLNRGPASQTPFSRDHDGGVRLDFLSASFELIKGQSTVQ